MTRKAAVIGAGLVLAAVSGGGSYFLLHKTPVPAYTVARVIDGDTFETTEKQLIRLQDVFAPEMKYCGGSQAKQELEKLVSGKPVYIKVIYRDQYLRLLSWVYTSDGFVNLQMIESGAAVNRLSGKTSPESDQLKAAAEKVRADKKGIYGLPCTQSVNVNHSGCVIKGNRREGVATGIYHLPGCGQYNNVVVQLYQGDQWFCTEAEAKKAGFVKAQLCPEEYNP